MFHYKIRDLFSSINLIILKYLLDGRNFQVEYAVKATENTGTAIGLKFEDGIVLAVEKIVSSKLLVPGKNKRILTIDRHAGLVCNIYKIKNKELTLTI